MNSLKNIVIYTMCAAIVVVSKELLVFLPNIELVSFLLILYTLNFELKGSIFIVVVFNFVQMLLYGISIWTPMYFIVWILLVFLVYVLKNILTTYTKCAIFSGIFGLIFGFLFSIPYFVISFKMGWIYFLKGIPFDLIHGISNYLIMLILFDKSNVVINTLSERYKL
ncbi:energy-coupling factor transport system substrate-specific component [Breznakia sp. PF5-3]|uniref:hypothetical protein n=1 Tax=unclassified Breznakia TaxID=2623764 RepID=UPI002406C58F|nr:MULTISPECIES: hypothetical protein [unclassified Breznakia]MDF9824047.1 energy-coupling factor transport system substrate-specific component [Breznakia sp. PM6-1]MDF9834887.1 energy-coupling factor transport system substrate-specific component [Breznakia sp. PF5-3]MDF9837091.1 energy-coupling factor transport system substrate-specific component [Breznakia sp. PFB2-8]MDF9859016.1 energy-coupling factor transport system substrate-specific component [Breznakia sp. PH5-24]